MEAHSALHTHRRLGRTQLPSPPHPQRRHVHRASPQMGHQDMDTSLPTTRTTRRPSRPPNRQEARRPHNHHLRLRRSPRARPIPRNTTNPSTRRGTPRHHNLHQDRGNNLTNRNPHPILQAIRGQTPRLGQKIAKTEYHETPRRHTCAKHRKITLYCTPKKIIKTIYNSSI